MRAPARLRHELNPIFSVCSSLSASHSACNPIFSAYSSFPASRSTCTPIFSAYSSSSASRIACNPTFSACRSFSASRSTCNPIFSACSSLSASHSACNPTFSACSSFSASRRACNPIFSAYSSFPASRSTCNPIFSACSSFSASRLAKQSYSGFPRNSGVRALARAELLGFSAQLRHWGIGSSRVTRIFRATPALGHWFERRCSVFPRNSGVGLSVRAELLDFSAQLRRWGIGSSGDARVFRATPALGHWLEQSYSIFPRNSGVGAPA
ncbi:hypothetical protein B8V81_2492 [Paenibacillus pasadenensis]|uniref:Uncharacterized protein n=1 Tax=Paenibacillus pasadenensis TaxID=217090 RepID=A0A2N5N146_9BACL|nr:hypothetical protein B8V81_2492 [Paenibacillus pasadenensis]